MTLAFTTRRSSDMALARLGEDAGAVPVDLTGLQVGRTGVHGGDSRVCDRRTQLRVRAVDGVRCGEDDVVPGRTVVHVERDLDRDPGAVGGYSHRGDGGDAAGQGAVRGPGEREDRKSTRLNSSH